jgi:phosphoribosylformylglycinamidine synthase
MTMLAQPGPVFDDADFASEAARIALASRLGPFGITLDPGELSLLVERLGRVPRWAELVIMNTMWSEHCSYKSTRHLLKRLPTEAPQVVLGPGQDAGAVRLGTHEGRSILCVLAHESHNHPSQIVPYEGAATGVGGIVRDVYCMGAEVVGTLDALRMGTGRTSGGLKAREILAGVVQGIADYGNALGVPNLGGDLEFHDGYDANVLVNVVAVGLVDEDRLVHSRVPGPGDYAFVLVGKPTDASGFGGAAFSSGVLGGQTDQRGAVQLPDPFLKRVLAVANRALLDLAHERGWAIGFKDLGAGGIACVTSELADHGGTGADIVLDGAHRVPEPLPPEVLLCAETQERFCFVVPWEARAEACAVFNERFRLGDVYPHAGASVIGRTRKDGTYRVTWNGEAIVECPVSFLTSGVRCERPATPAQAPAPTAKDDAFGPFDLAAEIRAAVTSLALCSRAPLYQRYDPEVQGRTTIARGAADAGVLVAAPGAPFGLAMAVDGNPRLGALDPGLGARNAVWESARNVVATGAWPWALTDCLNYGRPTDPRVMGQLEAGIGGLAEAARAVGTLPVRAAGETLGAWLARCTEPRPALPFVSGNVSLYNEDHDGRAVPASPIVACAGFLPDVSRTATPGLKGAGSVLLLIGAEARGRLGGSLFAERRGRGGDPSARADRGSGARRAARSWRSRSASSTTPPPPRATT